MYMKKLILWTTFAILLMIGCPWLTATFAENAGMLISIMLFFFVNPIYSIVSGIFAGRDIKKLWAIPIITTIMFLTGVWLFFDMGETVFLIYDICYLVIGLTAMTISAIIKNKQEKSKQS